MVSCRACGPPGTRVQTTYHAAPSRGHMGITNNVSSRRRCERFYFQSCNYCMPGSVVIVAIVVQVKGCNFRDNRRPHNSRLSVGDVVDVVNEPVNGKNHKFAYIVRQNAFRRGWVCVQHAKILLAACVLCLGAVLRGIVCVHVNPLEIALAATDARAAVCAAALRPPPNRWWYFSGAPNCVSASRMKIARTSRAHEFRHAHLFGFSLLGHACPSELATPLAAERPGEDRLAQDAAGKYNGAVDPTRQKWAMKSVPRCSRPTRSPSLDLPFCPKDTEQVKRLCQSTERYERQRRNLTHTRSSSSKRANLKTSLNWATHWRRSCRRRAPEPSGSRGNDSPKKTILGRVFRRPRSVSVRDCGVWLP